MADKKKEPDETLSEVLTGRERFINQYWDYTSTLDTAEQKGEKKGILKCANNYRLSDFTLACADSV